MSFLAGAFLAGLAGLAVPLWLHRRSQREPSEWTVSSLMLIRETGEPVRMHRALAHKVLLCLRLAALAAVTLAFAEPVLDMAGAGEREMRDRARLVVVDGSLSMRRDAVWRQAAELAENLVDEAEEAYLVLHGDRLTLINDARSQEPGFTRFDFNGLPARLDAFIASLPAQDRDWEVHLVSDFQASAVPERFNALVEGTRWPTVLHRVGYAADNWRIESAGLQGGRLEAVVAGHGENRDIAIALRADGVETARTTVAAVAGSPAVARFDVPKPGRNAVQWEVVLDAQDAIADDDVFRLVQPEQGAVTVAVLAGGAGEADAAAIRFLDAALKANGIADPVHVDDARDWPRSVDAAILVDPGEIPPPLLRRLERHLSEGGGSLLIAGPRVQEAALLPLGGETVTGRIAGGIRSVVAVDVEHPLAATSFQGVEVRRSLSLPALSGEAILALVPESPGPRSVPDAPWVVEKRFGKGRLLVLLTALDREWSSLVLRPAFVGFVRNTIDYLAENLPLAARAGEAVSVPASSVQIFDANGRRLLALNNTATRPVVRIPRPGFYTVRTPGREASIAVNVDTRESDLRSVPDRFLDRWQTAAGPEAGPVPDTGAADRGETESRRHPLAPWLLILAAVLLLVEALAANVGRVDSPRFALWRAWWRKGATA